MERKKQWEVTVAALLGAVTVAMASSSQAPAAPKPAAGPGLVPPASPTAPNLNAAPSPLAVTPGYQRVGGPEVGGTFEVPASGAVRGATWSDGAVSLQVLLERRPDWHDGDFFENHTALVSQQPVNLGWGTGTEYALDLYHSAAGGSGRLARLVHVVVQTADGRMYDFRSGAPPDDTAEQRRADQVRRHALATFRPLPPVATPAP